MKLQSAGPPERGSLSVVYACPECGYEMAMLTNAYETQIVQSLGVRIGPSTGFGAGPSPAQGASPSVVEASVDAGSRCPFSAMIAGPEEKRTEPAAVRWTAAAEARLANVPAFVRPMAKTGIEQFARERGVVEVDEEILDAARQFFGM